MERADGRKYNELRPVEMTAGFTKFAEGSVLIRCGDTVVLCNGNNPMVGASVAVAVAVAQAM